ncbi:MAG: hypothetical protein HY762_02125, partial [Planctomycetes bacterium]|nr:hypothetical protein [Planctomycetota bacterium]
MRPSWARSKLLKVDEMSCPISSEFTTPNPAVIRFTQGGHLEIVNFGIRTKGITDAEKRKLIVAVEVNIKQGVPEVKVGKNTIPLKWGKAEDGAEKGKIEVKVNEQELTLTENGYKGEMALALDNTAIAIWVKDSQGREASMKGNLQSPPLDIQVRRTSEKPIVVPELGIALTPEIMELKGNKLVKPAKFKIVTNYPNFIEKWKLQILEPVMEPTGRINSSLRLENCAKDEGGGDFIPETPSPERPKSTSVKRPTAPRVVEPVEPTTQVPVGYKVFKEFSGTVSDVDKLIVWDGKSDDGKRLIEPARAYKYVLTVIDRAGQTDQTNEGQFVVMSSWTKAIRDALGITPSANESLLVPIPANNYVERQISVEGKLYSISGQTHPKNKIVISTPDSPQLATIKPLEDGSFETELYLPVTEEEIIVEA